MSENGHEPGSFPDRIVFTSMFNDIAAYGSTKVQGKCLDSAKEVASYAARFRPGNWCFCGPGSEQTWKYNKSTPTSHFANGGWDKLASGVFKHASNREILTCCKHALQKRAAKQSHARECGIGVQSTSSVLRSEEMDSAQDASSASYLPQRFPSGRSHNHRMSVKMMLACIQLLFFEV